MNKTIPGEIAHLDFEPETKPEEEIELLKECGLHPKNNPADKCIRPARWQGILQCCGLKFYSCNRHKERGPITNWWCPTCKKTRDDEWVKWIKL